MMNRPLAAAIVISLGGHAALIGVLGILAEPAPHAAPSAAAFVAAPGVQSSTRVILTAPESLLPDSSPQISGVTAAVAEPEDSSEVMVEKSVPDPSWPADSLNAEASPAPASEGNSGPADSSIVQLDTEGMFHAGSLPGPGLMDTPPVTANTVPVLLSSLSPDYPVMARRSGLEGEVIIELTVDSGGTPTDYRIVPPRSHRILEEAAIRAVMSARFQPGTRNGHPATSSFRIKVRFELSPENV